MEGIDVILWKKGEEFTKKITEQKVKKICAIEMWSQMLWNEEIVRWLMFFCFQFYWSGCFDPYSEDKQHERNRIKLKWKMRHSLLCNLILWIAFCVLFWLTKHENNHSERIKKCIKETKKYLLYSSIRKAEALCEFHIWNRFHSSKGMSPLLEKQKQKNEKKRAELEIPQQRRKTALP